METQHTFRRAREAARALNRTASERIDRLLLALADAVEAGTEELLAANARDRSRTNPADPAYDRLLLDRGRLLGIAADLRNVAALPSPLGRILDRTVRPNGMRDPQNLGTVRRRRRSSTKHVPTWGSTSSRSASSRATPASLERGQRRPRLQCGDRRADPPQRSRRTASTRTPSPCCLPRTKRRPRCSVPRDWSIWSFRAAGGD